MEIFLGLLSLYSNLDPLIWLSLCRRLLPPVSVGHSARSFTEVEFPLEKPARSGGIISYLTKKHGGNVHEKGIVTITSKSVYDYQPSYAPENVAELFTWDSTFSSEDEPDQWICWDFHEMRVRPTHYTIQALYLKSWVVEGSLDGENWKEIDRQTDNHDFMDEYGTASFTVLKPVESRFIRLTQTDTRHYGGDQLELAAVEFFGTLSDSIQVFHSVLFRLCILLRSIFLFHVFHDTIMCVILA
jgi:hypothetical protein